MVRARKYIEGYLGCAIDLNQASLNGCMAGATEVKYNTAIELARDAIKEVFTEYGWTRPPAVTVSRATPYNQGQHHNGIDGPQPMKSDWKLRYLTGTYAGHRVVIVMRHGVEHVFLRQERKPRNKVRMYDPL